MEKKPKDPADKAQSGTTHKNEPGTVGGDHVRKAQEWGGGSKGSKGAVTKEDKRNENSSAKR